MKKKLLLVVLALAIMTSLTAGTLAVYTRTVTKTATVEAKQFAFSAEGSIEDGKQTISLAPTESMDYNFSIANVDEENGPIAEVPLKFDVTISFSGALSAMPGLVVKLYHDGEEVGDYTDGQIKYTAQSSAGVLFSEDYTVTLTWVDSADDAAQTVKGQDNVTVTQGLVVAVVAEQIVP
jgi:hypothetical protein